MAIFTEVMSDAAEPLVPETVLIPLDESRVLPAFVCATPEGEMAALVFGPATDKAAFLSGKWRPQLIRKLKTTDLPLRLNAWQRVQWGANCRPALQAGAAAFGHFVQQIARTPRSQTCRIDLTSEPILSSDPAAAVAVFQAPDTVPFEQALAHLFGCERKSTGDLLGSQALWAPSSEKIGGTSGDFAPIIEG